MEKKKWKNTMTCKKTKPTKKGGQAIKRGFNQVKWDFKDN